ncbi:hypothetical protein K505DRAFT_357341 [Melanomma pulvis-pyrius CBS 109.77]|uniref:Uncharacterized protein n=1 Tax=Melanomma pulvis-pyrius CBS 109.77 TaxID=1314802 RepID=A0A6A6XQC1_9PLEO|nr:hypothetical protein K505DRAFT_357341 [Melanomma pulvis-pyrius CBS 109.77]
MKEVVETKREQAITSSSKAQSLALATSIRQTLPRELRDLIYTFYLRSHPINWYRVIYNTYWNTASFRTWKYMPHFILPEYVGLATAREVGEVAFKIGRFMMIDYVGVLQLRHFLEYDHLGLGVLAKDWVREMVLVLDAGGLEDKESVADEKIGAKLERAAENIYALLDLRLKRNFALRIKFCGGRMNAIIVTHVLHMLQPVYCKLKEQGGNVTVQYSRRLDGRSDRPLLVLDRLLELPREEWRGRMLELCRSVGVLYLREKSWAQMEVREEAERPKGMEGE